MASRARTNARTTRRVSGPAGHQPRDPRFKRAGEGAPSSRRIWLARTWLALRISAIAAVLGVTGWRLITVITTGDTFAVRHFHVSGAVRLSAGEIEALLDGLRGRNMVLTPIDDWRDRLLVSPWVKEVSLRRALPDTIEVRVVERLPIAIARSGDALLLIDQDGEVVDELGPRYATLDLPLVDGLLPPPGTPGSADPLRLALVARVLQSLSTAGMLGRVSQLDVSRPRNAVVLLNHDATLLHLGDDRFAERLQSYLDMAPRLRAMVKDLESADLRFEDRVYVRPLDADVTFAPTPPVLSEETVEEALAEPDDGES